MCNGDLNIKKEIDIHIKKWVLWTNVSFYPIKQKSLKGLRFKDIVFIL